MPMAPPTALRRIVLRPRGAASILLPWGRLYPPATTQDSPEVRVSGPGARARGLRRPRGPSRVPGHGEAGAAVTGPEAGSAWPSQALSSLPRPTSRTRAAVQPLASAPALQEPEQWVADDRGRGAPARRVQVTARSAAPAATSATDRCTVLPPRSGPAHVATRRVPVADVQVTVRDSASAADPPPRLAVSPSVRQAQRRRHGPSAGAPKSAAAARDHGGPESARVTARRPYRRRGVAVASSDGLVRELTERELEVELSR